MTLNRLFQISWQQIPQFTVFVFGASFTNFRIHIVRVKVAFLSCIINYGLCQNIYGRWLE